MGRGVVVLTKVVGWTYGAAVDATLVCLVRLFVYRVTWRADVGGVNDLIEVCENYSDT